MLIFSMDTTDMPVYDDFLHQRKKTEFGTPIRTEVVQMKPEIYLKACASLHNSTLERQCKMIIESNVEHLIRAVERGEKLPLPMIDYVSCGQEGRHRAEVAARLGVPFYALVVSAQE